MTGTTAIVVATHMAYKDGIFEATGLPNVAAFLARRNSDTHSGQVHSLPSHACTESDGVHDCEIGSLERACLEWAFAIIHTRHCPRKLPDELRGAVNKGLQLARLTGVRNADGTFRSALTRTNPCKAQ